MKHVLVIARRDIADRWFVLVTAVVLGILPFLALALPSVRAFGRESVVVTIAGMVVIGYTLGMGLVLGATTIGSDLTERRLSFYFSRPVSSAAIWIGKFAAATFIVAMSCAVVFLPAYIYGSAAWGNSWNIQANWLLGALGGGAVALYLIAHAISTMVRSKTALLAFDFILAVAMFGSIWLIVRPLVFGYAFLLLRWMLIAIGAALFVVLFCAGLWQLSRGRVDRRASHVEFSRFLWPSIGVILLVATAVMLWITTVDPTDIKTIEPITARGSWAVVSGELKNRADYHEAFLYNVDNGASLRLHCAWCSVTITRDGKHAAWFRPVEWKSLQGELHVVSLEGSKLVPRPANIMVNPKANAWVLNDDGSRLAVVDGGLLSVTEVASNKILGAVRLADRTGRVSMFFETPDRLRLYRVSGVLGKTLDRSLTIYQFDVSARRLQQLGEFAVRSDYLFFRTSGTDASRLVTRVKIGTTTTTQIRDGRTGALIAEWPGEGFAFPLNDGSVAIRERRPDGLWIHVQRDTQRIASFNVGHYAHGFVSEELPGQKLLVTTVKDGKDRQWTTLLIDANRGTAERIAEGLRPVAWWFNGDIDPRPNGRSAAFIDQSGSLVRWNPLTGEKRVLLGGRKRG